MTVRCLILLVAVMALACGGGTAGGGGSGGTPALEAPTGLGATGGPARIDLSWTDTSTTELGFKVERAADVGGVPGAWSEISIVGPNITTFANTGLPADTQYHYRVRAWRTGENSGYSNTAVARTAWSQSFSQIEQGDFSSHPTGVTGGDLVIRDSAAWGTFYGLHKPGGPVPSIDFATLQILVCFLGEKSGGGWSIEITGLEYVAATDALFVEATEHAPPPGYLGPPVITHPYVIATTAKTAGPVTFRRLEGLLFTSIDSGFASGYRYGDSSFTGELLLFPDSASYASFWSLHSGGTPPAIDFTGALGEPEMGAAVLQGYRSTGGYGIAFKDAQFDAVTGRLIFVVEANEIPGMTDAITNPFDVIKFPKRAYTEVVERRNTVLPLTTLDEGSFSAYRSDEADFAGEVMVIEDSATWSTIWSKHAPTSDDGTMAPIPVVDFATEFVVCAWYGFAPSSGYAISVDRVVRTWNGTVTADTTRTMPGKGDIVLTVITYPFHFVKAPRP